MSRSAAAYLLYVVGGGGGLVVAAALIGNGGVENAIVGLALGVAIWWLAAGIAVRLGKTPRDFVNAVSAAVGWKRS
jgi:hypothetical protein